MYYEALNKTRIGFILLLFIFSPIAFVGLLINKTSNEIAYVPPTATPTPKLLPSPQPTPSASPVIYPTPEKSPNPFSIGPNGMRAWPTPILEIPVTADYRTLNEKVTPYSPPPPPQQNTTLIISLVALTTSGSALMGFVSTTVLAWKKEKRESRTGFLDIQLKELEIRKREHELHETKEKLKAEKRQSKKGTQRKRF
jgi:hypothetical protein